MCARATSRTAFGSRLADHGVVGEWIADSRVAVDAARLMVLHAAWAMDAHGAKAARHHIAAIKVLVPSAVERVIDRAIQTWGGAGVSQDTVLPVPYAQARFVRIADGPDGVHRRSLARAELAAEWALRVTR